MPRSESFICENEDCERVDSPFDVLFRDYDDFCEQRDGNRVMCEGCGGPTKYQFNCPTFLSKYELEFTQPGYEKEGVIRNVDYQRAKRKIMRKTNKELQAEDQVRDAAQRARRNAARLKKKRRQDGNKRKNG